MVYAYATTMRRAQGSTLDLVGLFFDRPRADRGYAYVGVSRARHTRDVYLVGRIRRTDWLPVGGDPRGNEQTSPGPLSWSDSQEESDSSSHRDEESEDSQEPSDAELDDPTAWNHFRPRVWEDPSDEESDGSEFGFSFEAEDAAGGSTTTKRDWAGLFE